MTLENLLRDAQEIIEELRLYPLGNEDYRQTYGMAEAHLAQLMELGPQAAYHGYDISSIANALDNTVKYGEKRKVLLPGSLEDFIRKLYAHAAEAYIHDAQERIEREMNTLRLLHEERTRTFGDNPYPVQGALDMIEEDRNITLAHHYLGSARKYARKGGNLDEINREIEFIRREIEKIQKEREALYTTLTH